MTTDNHHFTNLIFEGGGAKGCAYAGCVEVLASQGLYNNITQIGGTSAGAITASLLATGAGSDGLMNSIKHTDFRNFIADSWGVIGDAIRFVESYGLHTGDGFVSMLKNYFKQFSGNAEITFAELETLVKKNPEQFKSLTVIASNITNNRPQIFNAANNPDLPIWSAVRASMSIPLVFEPVKIDDAYHVDGGLAWNYPIDLYDPERDESINEGKTPIRNPDTLGFYLEPKDLYEKGKAFKEKYTDINSIGSFASSLISFMYQSANDLFIHPKDKERTVFIDDLGVSATDFSIPDSLVDELVASGKKATEQFLSN